jgi:hypothetical protein
MLVTSSVTLPFLDESYFRTVTLLQLHCQMVLPLHPHAVVDLAAIVAAAAPAPHVHAAHARHHPAETSCLCYLKMRRDEKGDYCKGIPSECNLKQLDAFQHTKKSL